MSSTEVAAIEAATRLADACDGILHETLVGAILHGSLTMDDFQPGTSDLDLLLVVERGLTSSEADALVEAVRGADPGPAGGVDLLVVTRRTAATPGDCPGLELLVGRRHGSGADLEVEGQEDQAPDLWPELSEARANGRSLLGQEPRVVIGEVPFDRVAENGMGWLRTWLERTDDHNNAAHMVLTACRMWRFQMTGEHTSKTDAARWAWDRDPSLIGVERALAARTTSEAALISADEVARVLNRVLRDLNGGVRD